MATYFVFCFLCVLLWFLPTCLLSYFSVNTEDGCSGRLKYLLKMLKILSLWYSRFVLRFLKENEKKLFRNLERTTLKLERTKSQLMFNETCYNNLKSKSVNFKMSVSDDFISMAFFVYRRWSQSFG